MKKILFNLLIISFIVGPIVHAQNTCRVNDGLKLINTTNPPFNEIKNILHDCDKISPNDGQVLLLHGLLARKEGIKNHYYTLAIYWLEKARQAAELGNNVPSLELAVTYEWANQQDKAKVIYQRVLAKEPNSRPALLGMARIDVAQHNVKDAMSIYQSFLKTNPNDKDALNGLALGYMVDGDYQKALDNYRKVLIIDNKNPDATSGVKILKTILVKNTQAVAPVVPCDANQGLMLLNEEHVPFDKIEMILKACDAQSANDEQVLLLHGLLERKKALKTRDFTPAIAWLKKAVAAAEKSNLNPSLELAVTYEWARQANNAKQIYTEVLAKYPNSKPALLGLARVALFNKDYPLAISYFDQVLKLHPADADALSGFKQVDAAKKAATPAPEPEPKKIIVINCHANEGLVLLDKPQPDYAKINAILNQCDRNSPNDAQNLLLHGLLARKQGQMNNDYRSAIVWLKKAQAVAPANDLSPALELAVTYEWDNQPDKAQTIYSNVIWKHPDNQAAALGTARIYLTRYQIQKAENIYRHLLQINSNNVDALNGLARATFIDNEFSTSRYAYKKVLILEPQNKEAIAGLQLLDNTTRYILGVSGGRYTLDNDKSTIGHLGFYGNINATDQLILEYTHNSNQLGLGLVLDPGPLPKNDVVVGFHRQIPYKYGWGVFYEYRERTNFNLENRVEVNGNVYLSPYFKLFGGMRDGWPYPWKNQLYYSGATVLTNIPIDVTLTGFWGIQDIGGNTSTYALDFSKEFSNNGYYVVGTAYSPSQRSWEVHGRVIIPLSKNHALEGGYERFYFNSAIAYNVGWRFYW